MALVIYPYRITFESFGRVEPTVIVTEWIEGITVESPSAQMACVHHSGHQILWMERDSPEYVSVVSALIASGRFKSDSLPGPLPQKTRTQPQVQADEACPSQPRHAT